MIVLPPFLSSWSLPSEHPFCAPKKSGSQRIFKKGKSKKGKISLLRHDRNQSPRWIRIRNQMVSISLYRGDLHRVPAGGRPRQWLLPPRAVSLRHFKILLGKRSLALSRLASDTAQAVKEEEEEEEEEEETKEKEQEGGARDDKVSQLGSHTSSCPPATNNEEQEEEETAEGSDPQAQESEKIEDVSASNFTKKEVHDVKFEVSNDLNSASAKEMRKIELESKLQVLNDKKHNLVQLLKQILNAEEEIKRRNMQSPGTRASVPLQTETVVELGSSTSASRIPPKLSVEVNFGGDSGGESDVAGNSNNTSRQLQHAHNTSPSAPSLLRPPLSPFSLFQNTSALHISRTNPTAVGLGMTTSSTALTSSSPSRFAAPVPPFPLMNTHYIASSPSPVASGVASSVFRDPNLSSPAPDRNKLPFS